MSVPDVFRVSERNDWTSLRRAGADVVLDPMVIRTADQFLRGSTGVRDPSNVWAALEQNIGALAVFVDAIILYNRIPVFNYANSDFGLDPRQDRPEPWELLKVMGDVLIPVHINISGDFGTEYSNLVAGAAEQVVPVPHLLSAQLANEISSQLEAYDYGWDPSQRKSTLRAIGEQFVDFSGPETDSGRVIRYLRGYLVFAGFAQLLGGDVPRWRRPAGWKAVEHVTPTGLVTPVAAVALGLDADDDDLLDNEQKLFARLAAASNEDPAGFGRTVEFEQPTFLPYLLDDPELHTPGDLLRRAVELRRDRDVRSYVAFRAKVRNDLARGHPEAHLQEIDELAETLRRKLSKKPRTWSIKLSGALSTTGASVGVEKGTPVDLRIPINWALRQLPHKRYAKLLLRIGIAQHETTLLNGLVRERWNAA
jgi:hypothetical protein